jgi:spore coat protein A
VVIDFSKYPLGMKVTLKNHLGDGTTSRVMRFHVVRKEKERSAVPERLSDMGGFEALGKSNARLTRKFRFALARHIGHLVWAINGKVFSPSRIDARPGGKPLPTDAGWKDTVDLRPGEVARVTPGSTAIRVATSSTATTWSTRI